MVGEVARDLMVSSTQRVWALPSRKSGWARMDCRNGMLVPMPSKRNSARARAVLPAASAKRGEALWTMTLARSES
jgi:hypothetical protein